MPFVADEIVTAAKLNMATFIAAASNLDSRTFTNSTYLDLDALTGGAGTMGAVAVSVTTGTSAKVSWAAALATTAGTIILSFRVSGATTLAASDDYRLGVQTTTVVELGRSYVLTGLTAGVNVFELQTKVTSGGTGTIARPSLIVEGVV